MGRGRRAKLSDEFLAKMVLEHHVDAVQIRKGGKGQGATRIHHVQWGWMPVSRYYWLDHLHDALSKIDPIKFAAFISLVFVNKLAIDAGTNVLAKYGIRTVEQLQSLTLWTVLTGALGALVFIFTPRTPVPPPDEVTKWTTAILAAALEIELGPAVLGAAGVIAGLA